jgi:thiosulfate dehydrogenase [quinone] large subunit
MKNREPISRRAILRGGMLLALTSIPAIFSKEAASAAGAKIVKLTKLPIGGTYSFTTASQGVPAIVFRTKTGVFAYSMICTHQGSTVTYNKSKKNLICLTHGAQYDPLKGAKPTAGPAERPLASIKVAIKSGWVVEA